MLVSISTCAAAARSCGWLGLAEPGHIIGLLPDPAAYLTAVTECGARGTAAATAAAAAAAAATAAAADGNPLLALLHSRLREGARVLSARGLPAPADVLAAATPAPTAKAKSPKAGSKAGARRGFTLVHFSVQHKRFP